MGLWIKVCPDLVFNEMEVGNRGGLTKKHSNMSEVTSTQPMKVGEAPNGGTEPAEARPHSIFFWIIAGAILAAALYIGSGYYLYNLTHETTDDAFIAGHVVAIAPRVEGQVIAVPVLDNQWVHSNDVLVELDPATYATTLEQRKASAEAGSSNYKAALAEYELMEQKVKTAEAQARSSEADVAAAEATATKADADYERAVTLYKEHTISSQEFDQARAGRDKAKADLNSARQKAASDSSKVDEAEAQKDAAWAGAGSMLAQSKQSGTQVDSARLDLSYTRILAPTDGYVTRKQVEPGDYLQAGQQVMSLVPQNVYVIANFKESQLQKIRPGMPAEVSIDAVGGREFRAHVDSIQAGSGAQFSMLPPENATGNFVKVVQRVPVKIIFDEPLPENMVIGPGLSVAPGVQTGSFFMPAWLRGVASAALALVVMTGIRLGRARKANS